MVGTALSGCGKEKQDGTDVSERCVPDSLKRVEFSDFEDILQRNLGPVFGARFKKYRRDYQRTLNSEQNGFVPEQPLTISMELVNRCNLSCTMCYTANHKATKRTLSLQDIERFFGDCKKNRVPSLMLGDHSEPLLHKDIQEIILAAKSAEIMDIFLFTNGVLLTQSMSEFLVRERVSRVFVSLDAAKPETFRRIRGKNELSLVESNLRRLLDIRNREKAELPVVRVSFCVQRDNAHEQEDFSAKWRDVVDFIDYQALVDPAWVTELVETVSVQNKALIENRSEYLPFCNQPFGYLSVLASGHITPCCSFYAHNLKFGHISTHSIQDVWQGDEIRKLRQELLLCQPNEVCRVCLSQRYEQFDTY